MTEIKRVLSIIVSTFFLVAVTWLSANRFYQAKISSLQQTNSACQEKLAQKNEPVGTLADLYLLAKKEKAMAEVKKSPLYFTAKTQMIVQNKWKVTIFLSGDTQGAADAADLKLDLPASITISDLKTGVAFPLYPRQVSKNNYILVTGLASFADNQVVLAKPQSVFCEFVAQNNNPSQPGLIQINPTDTKIFLGGESIYDKSKSISQINLQ